MDNTVVHDFGYQPPVSLLFVLGEPVFNPPLNPSPDTPQRQDAEAETIPDETAAEAEAAVLQEGEKPDDIARVPLPDYRALGMTGEHIPELIRLATDMSLYWDDFDEDGEAGDAGEVEADEGGIDEEEIEDFNEEEIEDFDEEAMNAGWYGVVHAWYALVQLEATEAAEPLLDFLRKLSHTDDFNDWANNILPNVIAAIGPHMLPRLSIELADETVPEFYRMNMAETIARIGIRRADRRAECVRILTDELARYMPHRRDVNAALVYSLIDLKAVESIDVIRTAYEKGIVPLSFVGDIEEVEIALGLRTERATPPRNWLLEEMEGDNPFMDVLDFLEKDFDEEDEHRTVVREEPKVGRNDPCPCGSGKKYKKCCLKS